ncbi:MAG TPA: permease-like cell division protein FtsX [Candidatus Saccharimonadales bacterium]|nr:permease-like cell division protein FtsX [Candidatus Saccharimonadales bacterium]
MKRKLVTLSRIINTGAVNFVRNAWLAIAAMAVMVITLTIVLFSIIANATFTNTIEQITAKIDVSAFLKDGLPQEDIDNFIEEVEGLSNVKTTNYVSKEEALKKYIADNSDNPDLLSAVSQTDNPLPATIQIKPNDLNRLDEIRKFLDKSESREIVADVSYKDDRKEAIDKITHATNLLQRAGIVAVLVFAVISVLIIFNTIQMAIFNRRDELTIMRLLGASTSYIRGPFVVESIIYGILSAIISTLLIHLLFVASKSALQATSLGLLDINYSATYFKGHFWWLLLMQLGIGILIGAVSSIVATRRYLKFKTKK